MDLVQELLERGSPVDSATKVKFLEENMSGADVKGYRAL